MEPEETLGDVALQFLRDLSEQTANLEWCDVSAWSKMIEPTEDNRNMLMMLMGHQLVPHLEQFTHTKRLLELGFEARDVEQLDHALDMAKTDFGVSGLANFLQVDWDKFEDPENAPAYYDELVDMYYLLVRGIMIARDWCAPQ